MKKIYDTQLEICWDNYFYHDAISAYAGKKLFGLIVPEWHGSLPKGVPTKYTHKYGMNTNAFSKAARYLQPIMMVKEEKESEGGDKYERAHTTLHSTST